MVLFLFQGLTQGVASTSSSSSLGTATILGATISSATLGVVTTLVTVLSLRAQRRKRRRALTQTRPDDLDSMSVTSEIQTQM